MEQIITIHVQNLPPTYGYLSPGETNVPQNTSATELRDSTEKYLHVEAPELSRACAHIRKIPRSDPDHGILVELTRARRVSGIVPGPCAVRKERM